MIDAESEIEICRLYKDGEPLEIIARQHGCTKTSVSRVAKRNGLEMRNGGAQYFWTQAETDLVKTQILRGGDAASIAIKLNKLSRTEHFTASVVWDKVRRLRDQGALPPARKQKPLSIALPSGPSAPRIIKAAQNVVAPSFEAVQPLRIVKGITQSTEQGA